MSFETEIERALRYDVDLGDLQLPPLDVIEELASGELRTLDQRSRGRSHRTMRYAALVAAILGLVLTTGFVVARGGPEESEVGTLSSGTQTEPAWAMISSSGEAPVDAGEVQAASRPSMSVRIFYDPSTSGWLAVFGPGQRGTSSIDSLPIRYEPLVIGAATAEVAYPSPLSNGLFVVKWGSDDESNLVASRGVAVQVVTAFAESLMKDAGATPPPAFTQVYSGQDLNPFADGTGLVRSVRYEDGTAYSYLPGVQTLDAYMWFIDDLAADQLDGRSVVIRAGNGRTVAYWEELSGVAIAESSDGNLADAVRAARPVDGARWAAERSRATLPGSVYQTATTMMD